MLVTGRLEPGAQLVNRKLADAIGMSMTPVREAVSRLASEGLVEHVPGAGAFVRRITRRELAQLYDVREALEPLAASQAALHATAGEIAELEAVAAGSFACIREIAARPERHADEPLMARWIDADRRFHEIVFEAARNGWLSKITGDMKLMAHGFAPQRHLPGLLTVAAAVRTWRGHRRLIAALGRRDAARASALVLAHIREGKAEVFAHLAAHGGPADEAELARRPIVRRGRPRKTDSQP